MKETKKFEKKLEVLITSGGTVSQIDNVRHIGNFSNGTTGAFIAEEFLKKGWKVHYLYSKNALRPFVRQLYISPYADFEEEIKRVRQAYEEFQKYKDSLIGTIFWTFDDYYRSVYHTLNHEKIDAVVLVAAVGDYGSEKFGGKISSDKEELVIRLKRNPKVISQIKRWKPGVFQVGFKLLDGISDEEMIEIAYRHGMKNKSDLTIANRLSGGKVGVFSTYIVFPEKKAIPVVRDKLAERLVEIVGERMNGGYGNG